MPDLSEVRDRTEAPITDTGFAAMTATGLDIMTASTSEKRAAYNALYLVGCVLPCTDPTCDCWRPAMAEFLPGVEIVPIRIAVKGDA